MMKEKCSISLLRDCAPHSHEIIVTMIGPAQEIISIDLQEVSALVQILQVEFLMYKINLSYEIPFLIQNLTTLVGPLVLVIRLSWSKQMVQRHLL